MWSRLKKIVIKDVEKGEKEEEDNHEPLLNVIKKNETSPIKNKPYNDLDLQLTNSKMLQNPIQRQHKRPLKLAIPENIPETTTTTPNSTPSPATTLATSTSQPRRRVRGDRKIRRLNTELLEAIECKDFEEVEKLLEQGANPNATCRLALVSACHLAAVVGGDALSLLLKHGADKHRLDKLGRTPLHIAAWFGHARQMAMLLDFPEELCEQVETDSISSGTEEDLRNLCDRTKILANTSCNLEEVKTQLPKDWKDNIDHDCREIKGSFPLIQPGWTPLHVASARARQHCTRLLLAAGADPNLTDVNGCTPLDVAGCAHYEGEDMAVDSVQFTSVVTQLLKAGGTHYTMRTKRLINNITTPLHTAAELECNYIIQSLLEVGASISCHNGRGETPLHVCVRQELEDPLQLLATEGVNDLDPMAAAVDVKDAEGHTVLQAAVEAGWVSGVCVALEADADLSLKANDGETALHSAAGMDNLDVLIEILGAMTQKDLINCQNSSGETPLFKAINQGNPECVKAILNKGASISIKLAGEVTVFHKASELGHVEILEELLSHSESAIFMLNELSNSEAGGIGALHYAVLSNNVECLRFLLKHGADVRLRTTSTPYKESTPLHLASLKNYVEVTNTILEHDRYTIHEVNGQGWYPLHTAAYHGSRDVIPLLLQAGADLSGCTEGPKKFKRTAIEILMNNISKPTKYMENLFDTYISTNNQNLQDADCEVTVDYSILMPRSCEMEQMKVVEALIKTGNRYGQKRVLIHPLVESFLYLKWKALLPFFYAILALYALFVMSLTIFTVSVFYYRDTHESTPLWLNAKPWGYLVYFTILLIVFQELLYMNVKSNRYFLQLETWIKFGSLGLALVLPGAVTMASTSADVWLRHVATVALLLSWIEMMFLLSRFPNWGYYVLMFGKVAVNVIKILLTFGFLVIGFSLSFMIQFRSHEPFDGPWAAFVKTMVMMTSEFDYEALFDEHAENLSASIVIVRIIFMVFLILAAIVLMNLMVGVAVNDINHLEILGNIQRLAKQVQFLGTLDILLYNKFFTKVLPKRVNEKVKRKRNVSNVLVIYPAKPRWKYTKLLPSKLREALFNKATTQKKLTDDESAVQAFKKVLDEIHKSVVKDQSLEVIKEKEEDSIVRNRRRYEEIVKQLDGICGNVSEKLNTMAEEAKEPMEKINVKIDQLSVEIESLKGCLGRLESKLGKLHGDERK